MNRKMTFNIIFSFEDANDEVKAFFKQEWVSANLIQFGRDISNEIKPLTVTVFDDSSSKQILAAAQCLIMGETLRVSQLLVKEEYRKLHGLGSYILQQLEELAYKNNWHKIRLSTIHQNLDFYQKNGYSIEATLENDAFHSTWYILSKFVI